MILKCVLIANAKQINNKDRVRQGAKRAHAKKFKILNFKLKAIHLKLSLIHKLRLRRCS